MFAIGISTGTPTTGIARTSAKKKKPRGISFEQFTGERAPFELTSSVTRHRSATLGARATSGLRGELILPHSELITGAGGADENVTKYDGESSGHNGGSASLREDSPAARIKARHEWEEQILVNDDPQESPAAQSLVHGNRQDTSPNTSDSGAEKSLATTFGASHERHAHRGGEGRHTVLLHARLEHHLSLPETSDLQRIRATAVETCNVGGNGCGSAVETAQRPQHTPSREMDKDKGASCLCLSWPPHSFNSADTVVKVDDLDPPMIRAIDESDDFATGLPAPRDASNEFYHYLSHDGTPVSGHESMSTSPPVPNALDNPPSQLLCFGLPFTSSPGADTRLNAGSRLSLSRIDACGPISFLTYFGSDGHVVPTALRQTVQSDRDYLSEDGLIDPSSGHGFDEHGIPLASFQTIQRDLDLCKVVPSPKRPTAVVASIAIPSHIPLPSAAAPSGLRSSAKPSPGATDTQALTQVPCTPRRIPADTHSINSGETLRQNAVRSQHADNFPPENLRPGPQILRYGPFQTQQAHQSRNTPLGSGRLQNASKSGM